MLEEFRKFVVRGNVVDMAVGIIIGAAFGRIVTSLVNDVLMPPLGLLLGGVDFSNLFVNLGAEHYASLAEAHKAGAATINYGVFVNTVLNFLIVAAAIFILIKAVNRLKFKDEAPPAAPATKACPECLAEIPADARRCRFCTSPVS